jgi:pterin-4a-carbinolamine dehydratase
VSQFASSPSPTTPVTQRLKSERVQEALGAAQTRLKSERVQEMLAAMPAWTLLPAQGEAINRLFPLPSARVAEKFADYISAYAEVVGQNVHLEVSEDAVELTLTGPKLRGRYVELTEEVVAFAQKFG